MRSRLHRRIAVSTASLAAVTLLAGACSSSTSTSSKPASQPKKIVSLSPTATEDLFAIGAGSQVVAVDSLSDFPAGAPVTSLSAFKPSVEAIAKYNPDLVVVSDDSSKIVESLQKLKVPVILDGAANTLDDAYGQITALGQATGHVAEAAKTVADMKAKIAAAVASAKKPATPLTYYYEVGTTPYYSATSKTFIGSIFARFGLTNIADAADKTGTGYPQMSDEGIVAAAPDLVFLADTTCCQQSATTVAARPGWSAVPAVKNEAAKGTVVGLSDDVASRWGPRLADLVQQIAAAVNKAQG